MLRKFPCAVHVLRGGSDCEVKAPYNLRLWLEIQLVDLCNLREVS